MNWISSLIIVLILAWLINIIKDNGGKTQL